VEANPLEGLKTNVLGTVHIADAAKRHGVKTFVMISTDKAVNPTNVMGATKRAAEAYCQAIDLESESTHFKTVRFGNVLGSNGSVVPRFRDQIAKGGPVTVTHPEIVRYFMSIPEAVRLVLQASVHGMNSQSERGKILVLDMGEPVKIDDLARKMIYLAGFKPGVDIHIVYTGLRPGEKLYEELFAESEPVDSNNGRGYMIAGPRAINAGFLRKSLAEMRAACDRQDSEKAIAVLRHIVPEFRDSGATPAQKGVQVLKAHFPDEMDDTLPS
jgi:O-antigen biosynthesis protein WbqV